MIQFLNFKKFSLSMFISLASFLVLAFLTHAQSQYSHYRKVGWHKMVHEILHRLGTVDIYQTSTTFGIISERERALEIDPKADESIIGDDTREREYI